MQASEHSVDGREVRLTLTDGSVILNDGTRISKVELERQQELAKRKEVTVPQPAVQLGREIESGRSAQRTLERMHRKLVDLPEQGDKMNAICAVITYSNVGLSDEDIAIALRTTPHNIKLLKECEPYKQLAEMFDQTVFEDAKKQAKHIISRNADKAAQKMVDMVQSEDESIAVVASREVLRLSGVEEKRSDGNIGGLRIVIETADDVKEQNIHISVNGD